MGQHPPPLDWHSLNESELERLNAGDDDAAARGALAELRRRHDDALRARARRQCGSAESSADAMQDLDVKLREKRRSYDPEKGRWLTWAKTLLRNLINDQFRTRSRHAAAYNPTPGEPGSPPGDPADQLPSREPAPDQEVKLWELQEAMAACLQGLSPREREVLILQVLEGRTLEAIGEETGVGWRTAGTRAHRAKQKMRDCLKRKGYQGEEP